MIMTGILTAALSASAVYAGETTQEAPDGLGSILSGVLDSVQENSDELKQALFGEDGPLKDVLPEGNMLRTYKEFFHLLGKFHHLRQKSPLNKLY